MKKSDNLRFNRGDMLIQLGLVLVTGGVKKTASPSSSISFKGGMAVWMIDSSSLTMICLA